MKAIVHLTREFDTVEECKNWYDDVKALLKSDDRAHLNGQVTVKFQPSHPEGTPEEGPKP